MKKLLSLLLLAVMILTLSACGGGDKQSAKSADLKAVLAKFTFDGEMLEMDENDMLDVYGIQTADMKQFAAAVNTSGIDCDEVVLVEAKDADAASRVKEALDKRYQAKLNETENYLPDEYAVIKTCSVVMDGSYVAMIVAPNAADLVKIYNESFK